MAITEGRTGKEKLTQPRWVRMFFMATPPSGPGAHQARPFQKELKKPFHFLLSRPGFEALIQACPGIFKESVENDLEGKVVQKWANLNG